MARTLEEAFKVLAKWYESDSVGSLTIHKSPQKTIEIWEDAVIKLHEMSSQDRELWLRFMENSGSFKAEAIARKDGPADRVKITRIVK